jgi:2-octaprenyl-6-methoxyphenol hydroxylase|tara:strand:+ start:244 stop:1338 length:1095 start_codon:yes stop_codon:yes gene_type:complete
MNVCLIGDSITSLALAKNLVNKKIKVFLYYQKSIFPSDDSRTIGISKNNLDFFNREIVKLSKKKIWKINEIEIYNYKESNEKILNFKNSQNELFSIIKNFEIYSALENSLKNNKLFKKFLIKSDKDYDKILDNKNFSLIINCNSNNKISKNFFKKINKSYGGFAYTTIIEHKKIKNFKAEQTFTKKGPIAFLPLSNIKTSIVFSINNETSVLNDNEIRSLILYYNNQYEIKNFKEIKKFNLSYSTTRNYYHKNVMAFGDNLHKIHPLAGQGFNMTLRDIKILSNMIQSRIDLGLPLDHLIYNEFEKKTKHLNFIFSSGIDFIHEFFKLDNKFNNKYSNGLLKFLGKNEYFNKLTRKYANRGLFF